MAKSTIKDISEQRKAGGRASPLKKRSVSTGDSRDTNLKGGENVTDPDATLKFEKGQASKKKRKSAKSAFKRDTDRGYPVRGAAYALQPQPPIEYVIDGIVAKGSTNLWVGKYGAKKTWAFISACVCVATGKPWLGYETKHSNVLIIDEESGDERLRRRIGSAIRGEYGDDKTRLFYVSLVGFNLYGNTLDDTARITELIRELDAKLVVIDALIDIVLGGDENSSTTTGVVFHQLRTIAEKTGAAIIVVHHTNKEGEYRGSSAIPGSIDTMVSIKSDQESNFITFQSKKVRDGQPFHFAAEAHWREDRFYLTSREFTGKSERSVLGRPQQYVINYLAARETKEDLLANIASNADTCSPRSARNAVYDLASQGIVVRSDSKGPGSKAVYKLTEKGLDFAESKLKIAELRIDGNVVIRNGKTYNP